MINKWIISIFLFCCLLQVTAAWGANFTINAVIERPLLERNDSSGLRARFPTAASPIRWVPASFQLVEVYQSHMFGPQFCGQAFLDDSGRFPPGTNFTCGGNLPAQVQIVVRGESLRGFRVGSNSPYPWEQLSVAYAYSWYSQWQNFPSTGSQISFSLRLGSGQSFQSLDFRTAALVDIVDFLYQELNGGIGLFSSPDEPLFVYSKWIINDVSSQLFGLSAPWTYWDTIHNSQAWTTERVLWAAGHELAHVLYNQRHSDWGHYSVEVFEYLKNHNSCDNFGTKFAHYEGFASAIDNLIWAHYGTRNGIANYNTLEDGCAAALGLSREGNVTELYTYAFAGNPISRPNGSRTEWTTRRIGVNEYSFPPLVEVFRNIERAGMLSESLSELWSAAMRDTCISNDWPYCLSLRFQCLALSDIISQADSIYTQFFRACGPEPVWISSVGLTNSRLNLMPWSSHLYEISFVPSVLSDSYRLRVDTQNGTAWDTTFHNIDISGQNVRERLLTTFRNPRCAVSIISIESSFAGQTILSNSWRVDDSNRCNLIKVPIKKYWLP